MYIYAECEELGSTILSKNPTSGKYHIAKIAIWYYRGGSCSNVYSNLGINRKNGFGESPARYKPDERIFVGKTILLNTGGSCSGVIEKLMRNRDSTYILFTRDFISTMKEVFLYHQNAIGSLCCWKGVGRKTTSSCRCKYKE